MDSGEIVVHRVDRDHRRVVLNLLAETICQSSKAPHAHPHRQIVTFHVGRADMLGIGIAAKLRHYRKRSSKQEKRRVDAMGRGRSGRPDCER